MRPRSLDPHGVIGWLEAGGVLVRSSLRSVAHHTGLPIVLVAAIAIVASRRLMKHGFALAVELVVAVGLLMAATTMGWLRW